MNKPIAVQQKAAFPFSSQEKRRQWQETVQSSRLHQEMIEEIRAEAASLSAKQPVRETYADFSLFAKTGSRLEYERVYFQKRRRLNTFALLAFWEPDTASYKEELNEAIWAMCDEYTWCLPAHLPEQKQEEQVIDLFAAETAMALSEILCVASEAIDPAVQARVGEEIERRVFAPYRSQSFHWETATHNWASVCAGSIGSAAIHLVEDADVLEEILQKVLRTMERYMDGFEEDGACTEGYGYWQYGFGYFVYFADLLHQRTGGEIDLLADEKVHQAALFQQKCFLSGSQIANFSDALPEARVFLGLSHYLNGRFPDVHVPPESLRSSYSDDHCSRWAPAFRNLLWMKPEKGKAWPDASYFLADAQWFVSRHRSYAFAAKGGHNAEPHNHNDLGHFMLSDENIVYLQDIGSGMYNRDYFGEKRYSFLCNGSHGHSVPIVNDHYQREGRGRAAEVKQAAINDEMDRLDIELANAYDDPTLKRLTRAFRWGKSEKPSLSINDFYQFTEKPKSIVERLVAPVMPVDKQEKGIVLGGALFVQFDSAKLMFNKEITEYFDHFGRVKRVMLLDFEVIRPEETGEIELKCQFL